MSDWDKEALEQLHSKIVESTAFLSIFTESYKEDPTALLQLVFAMMTEKPIFIVAPEGTKIPPAFLKIANAVEFFKDKEDLQRKVSKLLKENALQ